jgi:ribosomal protein S27E
MHLCQSVERERNKKEDCGSKIRVAFLQFIQFFWEILCYDDNRLADMVKGSEMLNWLMRFTYWYNRVMAGRYGSDQLSIALIVAYLLLNSIANIFRIAIFYYLAVALLIWGIYRIFSKNISRRYRENAVFLEYWHRFLQWFRTSSVRFETWREKTLYRMNDKKTHKYYRCPNCKNTLRVPKGKGKIVITCPVCHTEFIKKT